MPCTCMYTFADSVDWCTNWLYDHTYSHTGVYLSSKGIVYANNSVISITEIGETDVYTYPSPPHNSNNGLQCITDRMPCCRFAPNTAGEWLFPDGTMVPGQSTALTFYRNRGHDDGTVNLNRLNNVMIPTGKFCCVIPDATDAVQWACASVQCELVVGF